MQELLYSHDATHATHPAESIDLVCVADLGTWTKMTYYMEHHGTPGADGTDEAWWNPEMPFMGETITTSHAHIKSNEEVTPLALFLSALYGMMSWHNPDMTDIANDFRRSNSEPAASGFSRPWPAHQVLSDGALSKMRDTRYDEVNRLDSKVQGNFLWQ